MVLPSNRRRQPSSACAVLSVLGCVSSVSVDVCSAFCVPHENQIAEKITISKFLLMVYGLSSGFPENDHLGKRAGPNYLALVTPNGVGKRKYIIVIHLYFHTFHVDVLFFGHALHCLVVCFQRRVCYKRNKQECNDNK